MEQSNSTAPIGQKLHIRWQLGGPLYPGMFRVDWERTWIVKCQEADQETRILVPAEILDEPEIHIAEAYIPVRKRLLRIIRRVLKLGLLGR